MLVEASIFSGGNPEMFQLMLLLSLVLCPFFVFGLSITVRLRVFNSVTAAEHSCDLQHTLITELPVLLFIHLIWFPLVSFPRRHRGVPVRPLKTLLRLKEDHLPLSVSGDNNNPQDRGCIPVSCCIFVSIYSVFVSVSAHMIAVMLQFHNSTWFLWLKKFCFCCFKPIWRLSSHMQRTT